MSIRRSYWLSQTLIWCHIFNIHYILIIKKINISENTLDCLVFYKYNKYLGSICIRLFLMYKINLHRTITFSSLVWGGKIQYDYKNLVSDNTSNYFKT